MGTAALGTLLVACGTDEAADPSSPAASDTGPWSFVDDRGQTVTLPTAPTRIIAEADAAAALWDWGIRPIGIFGSAPLEKVQQIEQVDLGSIETVGEVYGEINMEAIAALDADLVVAVWYQPDDYLYGMKNGAQQQQLEQIAPTVGINAHVVADAAIDRFGDLSAALGADLDAPDLKEQQHRYETGSAALTGVAAQKGLRVMAIYPGTDELYVLRPEGSADLALIQQLGVDMVEPDGTNPYYDIISWENADMYPADVIVMDARVDQFDTGGFADLPTWKLLPAVQADQVGTWITPAPFSYRAHADVFDTLTALLERSESVTS